MSNNGKRWFGPDKDVKMKKYAIEFEFPEGKAFAGPYKEAAGWAPTIKTAWLYDSYTTANNALKGLYGSAARFARVVEVDAEDEL